MRRFSAVLYFTYSFSVWAFSAVMVFASEMPVPVIPNIAHRGASRAAPENTLAAYRAAAAAGANGAECDVRKSAGGVLVLAHDETAKRTAGTDKKWAEMTYDEISKLDAGIWKGEQFKGEKIPTFDDYLALLQGTPCRPVVEIKEDGIAGQVVEAIRRRKMTAETAVIAFSAEVIREVRRIEPKLCAGWLYSEKLKGTAEENAGRLHDFFVTKSKELGTPVISIRHELLSEKLVQSLRQAHIHVWTWTVNDAARMKTLLDWGVESITTDQPDVLNKILAERRNAVQFYPAAAQKLLEQGITEILFIRRFTFTANHVYTEYVNSKWMPGGGICALDLRTGNVREIVPELTRNGVVMSFDLSFDARKIVFDFKKGDKDGYRIYEVNIDGTGLRQLTFPEPDEAELVKKYRNGYHHGTDDTEPCYLPDGGIVFATTRCQFGVLCDNPDIFTVRNLYRMNGGGTEMKPLTYSPLSEASPAVLPDGRILYMRWEYIDKAAGNAKGLWSINPDGSGVAEVYGNSITFPETMIQARPVPNEPNKILMLGCSHWRNNTVGTVVMVDTTKNIRSPEAMTYITDDVAAFAHDGFHFRNEKGKWYHEKSGKPGRLFRNPYPVTSELFLVSHKPKGLEWSQPDGYDISLLDKTGKTTLLLKDPAISLWSAYPVKARTKPPVFAGQAVDAGLAEQGLARCFVSDIYTGMENVKRGDVKYIRILEQVPRKWSERKFYGEDKSGMAHSAIGNGFLSVKVQHGVVPVEEDGSAYFVVPAGKAVYFQALDKDYRAVQTERTFVHYKAGETRSCIGCHETPNVPPNTSGVPKASQRPASVPAAQQGQTAAKRVFDYDRQIQPILDKHCVSCHGGQETQKGLDLRGQPAGVYSVSYNALVKLGNQKQLLGSRRFRNEDIASNSIEYIPPYQLGALSSPLAAMLDGRRQTSLNDAKVNQYAAELSAAHPDLKLTDAEKLAVSNWLDINCQFHPSYGGRLHEKFQNEPDYRPDCGSGQ
ncbi:MAG: hypothetical protein LBH00_00555 [Planctomycetaceae bacterium]|jgi:glycerophosphoryl diester phosphodiesterase/mono/diheme cytochrome c family protein|nr:hypothetical protein [Planctomycetaceae bacterium]